VALPVEAIGQSPQRVTRKDVIPKDEGSEPAGLAGCSKPASSRLELGPLNRFASGHLGERGLGGGQSLPELPGAVLLIT